MPFRRPNQNIVPGSAITIVTEFAGLPIAGGVCALDGTIIDVNDAAEELFDRRRAEVIGRKAWDLAPGTDLIWDDILLRARTSGPQHGEIAIATPRATKQIYYVASVREHDGRSYVLIFAHGLEADRPSAGTLSATTTHRVTAGAKIEQESKHRLEALGLVAGGIAHDFNNQLVSVLAEASATREETTLSESGRESLRRIEAAAHRMAQLTRQLLAYAGRGRFVTELFDPDELVVQMHEQLVRAVPADARLDVQPGAGRIAIEADRGLLRQVIVNLVANAADALDAPGGTVRIATRLEGDAWLLQVVDSGRGMDDRTLARIFDPFFTTKPDRHGLGLSAVHGIVRRLGGMIAIDTTPGRGTTVSVRLPVVVGVEPERRRSTSKQPPLATLRGLRILVADDEPSVRATVRRLLERRGAEVVLAEDGADAHARLRYGTYHVVLFDVMMPQLTGYQLVPLARELQPSATVLLMSGYSDHRRAAGGADEPDAFLEKPFTAKVLDDVLDQLLVHLR